MLLFYYFSVFSEKEFQLRFVIINSGSLIFSMVLIAVAHTAIALNLVMLVKPTVPSEQPVVLYAGALISRAFAEGEIRTTMRSR